MADFEFPVRIYWEDTDAGGVVYYANYLKFFERARTEWLRALGVNQQRVRERLGGMFVAVEASVRYMRPARLDDQLVATAGLLSANRASVQIRQQAWRLLEGGERELLCQGTVRTGWVDSSTFQPTRIPSEILQRLKS